MMIQRHTGAAAALLTLLLSACVSPPTSPPATSAKALHAWQAEGKLGLRTHDTAKAINFRWEHNAEQLEISLYGALGIGGARLSRDSNGTYTLSTKDGIETADSAESMLENTLGWSLPVTALEYWIKGLPAPETPIQSQTRDEHGNLTQLQQQGWLIRYTKHANKGAFALPKKIVASHGALRLTIAIKSWRW